MRSAPRRSVAEIVFFAAILQSCPSRSLSFCSLTVLEWWLHTLAQHFTVYECFASNISFNHSLKEYLLLNGYQLPSTTFYGLAAPGEAPGPGAAVSPGSLLERQSLGPCLKLESESSFKQDSQAIHRHIKVWETLLYNISIISHISLTQNMTRLRDIVICLSSHS